MNVRNEHRWAVGDEVVIADYSEAHGDTGKIDCIQKNGIILVELDQGCIWPVTADELQRKDEPKRGA
jgi:hypothetical protein